MLVLPLGLINLKFVEYKIPRGFPFCLPSSPVSCIVTSSLTYRTPGPCFGPAGQGLLSATTYLEVLGIELFSSLCSCSPEFKHFLQVWCERDFILDLPAIVWNIMFQSIKRWTGWLFRFFCSLPFPPPCLWEETCCNLYATHVFIAANGELSSLDDLELMV